MLTSADTVRSRTVIFLHMPKAGGSTLNHLMDWHYERVFTAATYDRLPVLLALPDEEKRRLECVKGMVYYGIHRALPRECVYVTVLRHPIERVISNYYYQFERSRRLGEPIPTWTVDEWLDLVPFQPSYQLRLLVGGDDIQRVLHDPLPADAVDIARRHLAEHFAVAGTLARYDESLLLIKRALGWTRTAYARQNVNARREAREALPPETLARLERECAPEMALYEHVARELEAQIAAQGPDFAAEVAALRRASRRFERLWHLAGPLRGTPLWNAAKRAIRLVTLRR